MGLRVTREVRRALRRVILATRRTSKRVSAYGKSLARLRPSAIVRLHFLRGSYLPRSRSLRSHEAAHGTKGTSPAIISPSPPLSLLSSPGLAIRRPISRNNDLIALSSGPFAKERPSLPLSLCPNFDFPAVHHLRDDASLLSRSWLIGRYQSDRTCERETAERGSAKKRKTGRAKRDGFCVEGATDAVLDGGDGGSFVHKRTVHLLPTVRIKGVRMFRPCAPPPLAQPLYLALSRSPPFLPISLSPLVLYLPLPDCLRPSSTPNRGLST